MRHVGATQGWVKCWEPVFLRDYMFNLLHISKIVCYDRANLQRSLCECQANERKAAMKPLMESQWTSEPPGLGEQTALPLEPRSRFTRIPPRISLSVIITCLAQGEMPPGWKEGVERVIPTQTCVAWHLFAPVQSELGDGGKIAAL